ncbi:hypothetical protein C0993_004355 [Termitomyces sp. T159_Od127]|nr:hypothetical protein C0993_004355 [Termitomyces sp. T159_Od127]
MLQQMIHAKTYAAEGRAFERSWKREEVQAPMSNLNGTPGPQKTSKLVMDIGFGTPVLKPREARRFDGNQEIAQTKDSVFSNVENVTREDEALGKRVLKQKQKRKQRRSSGLRKGSSIHGSENEYEQRRSDYVARGPTQI